MANYRFSTESDKDLLEIARYTIQDFGVRQARIYKEGIFIVRILSQNMDYYRHL